MNLGWQPQFSLPQTVKSVAESLDTMPDGDVEASRGTD